LARQAPEPPKAADRIALIDEIRGFCVLLMVFYHGFFLLDAFFDVALGARLFTFFGPVEPPVAATFIIISGLCSRLSRNNLRRGVRLFLIALTFSVTTIWLLPKLGIEGAEDWFGILSLLSVSMLLFSAGRKVFDSIPAPLGALLCLLLYLFTYNISAGSVGLFDWFHWKLPAQWYELRFLFPLGIHRPDFTSADYFPLLPNVFLFLFGSFLGVYVAKGHVPEWSKQKHLPLLGLVGRSALAVYLLHLPLLYGLFSLVQSLGETS
jgi:uncharacterized membrane protein